MASFDKQEPKNYQVKGHDLTCPVCSNKLFRTKQVLLNTAVMSFFNLDWANRNATCFVCSDCTNMLWFFG